MIFNPITQTLFTNDGQFVKKLHCPYGVRWDGLVEAHGSPHRSCSVCQHPILDTATMADSELLSKLRSAPDTCLKVDLDQPNLIVSHVVLPKSE
jgi:hypothetical protein